MTPQAVSGGEVVSEVFIEAPPEEVYEFFTVPEKLAQWWGSGCSIDPRPGGMYRVEFVGGRVAARGEFVELIPHRRVVHTWGWEDDFSPIKPGESLVEITLRRSGEGTLVTVRHTGLAETTTFHQFGWDFYLPRLAAVVGGEDPREGLSADMLDRVIEQRGRGPDR